MIERVWGGSLQGVGDDVSWVALGDDRFSASPGGDENEEGEPLEGSGLESPEG